MTQHDLDLDGDFPPQDRAAWRRAVERGLHGRDFDSVLVARTRDGLEIQPLYTADDSHFERRLSGSDLGAVPVDEARIRGGWDVRQLHGGPDPLRCNREILEDLERGVTSVELEIGDVDDVEAHVRTALDGVILDRTPVALGPHTSFEAALALAEMVGQPGEPAIDRSWLGLDPLGGITRGDEMSGLDKRIDAVSELAVDVLGRCPDVRVLTVDTTRHAAAGATEAQQLAVSLATGAAYLRGCESAGLDPSVAASAIAFRFDATADQFLTIAMLRAARRTWARVLETCGVAGDGRTQIQQAVTSREMFSRRDPSVNLLRATTAALAAGIAGVDAVTVLPFDCAFGRPESLGRRTARNTQLLLIEECHISRLVDPTAGSWFVESLTDRLANMAWSGFRAIESSGGMASVLADGSLEAEVAVSWESRLRSIAVRSEPLTGVSEFPDPNEHLLRPVGASTQSGWPVRRPSQQIEDLRDVSDRHLAAHGSRPKVFVVTLGDEASHAARSTWVVNLLAVAGIAAVGADGAGALSPIEAEARFVDSGCDVAVLCSSDDIYAERAAATAMALREAGAVAVALAGRPGRLRHDLETAGVSRFWHEGIDVVETLRELLELLTTLDL